MTRKKLLPKLIFKQDQTIVAQLYDFLRELITQGRILPDTPLTENDLATHFAISRQPVRQALLRLSHDGLIDVIPQRGSFVTKISVSNLIGICFIRCAIECNAVYEGFKLDDKTFKSVSGKLKRILKNQTDLVANLKHKTDLSEAEKGRFLKLDDKFHCTICSFSGTDLAWQTIQSSKANMDRIRYLSIGRHSNPQALLGEHQALFEAIEQKNFDAASFILRDHLYEITKTYQPIMQSNAEWFYIEN